MAQKFIMWKESKKMKTKALVINQNGFKFYVVSLNAKILYNICSTSINEINIGESDVYQRRLNNNRVNRIKEFSNRSRALFPTAIVLNSLDELNYNEETMQLEIPEKENNFFIIDGQHRIKGIKESHNSYELCVVIFNNISRDLQSELFITINSEQKTVNSNVRFNIKSNDAYNTPEKVVRNIAEIFNNDPTSPLYKKIWMDDTPRKKGTYPLSLSTFCNPICGYIYNSNDYYKLKDDLYKNNGSIESLSSYEYDIDRYFLWTIYLHNNEKLLYKILLNYFTAIKHVYSNIWNDSKSVIIKTTGYNAFMLLFKYVFLSCKKNNNNFSLSYIERMLKDNKIDDSEFDQLNAGLGKVAAFNLFLKLQYSRNGKLDIFDEFISSFEDTEDEND